TPWLDGRETPVSSREHTTSRSAPTRSFRFSDSRRLPYNAGELDLRLGATVELDPRARGVSLERTDLRAGQRKSRQLDLGSHGDDETIGRAGIQRDVDDSSSKNV